MSDPLKVEIKLERLQKYIADFPVRVIHRALELIAFALKGAMVEEAPVKHGFLRGSIEEPSTLGPAQFGININAEYWKPVQFGSGIHGPKGKPFDIYPKTGNVLSFIAGGERITVRHVKNHPGQKPNPFIDRAIDGLNRSAPSAVQQALEEAA